MQLSSRILPAFLLAAFCSSQFVWSMSTEQMGHIRSKLQESKQSKRRPARAVSAGWQARLDTAVTAARNLIGRKYDQTMGTDGGKNYAAGQIVCVDVPRLALADAGVPMARVLEEDARLHSDRYPIEKGRDNIPSHPIFARRTRNWLRWCRGNGRLLPPTATPKPGDVVFYGDIHISFVSSVEPDGHYKVVECAPGPGLALEQYDWMVEMRGWKATGFGRVLPLPATYASLVTRPKTVIAKPIDPTHALENLQQNHPGLANLATILARLNGKPMPTMIVKVNGKPVMKLPGTTVATKAGSKPAANGATHALTASASKAASEAAAEAAGQSAGKAAIQAILAASQVNTTSAARAISRSAKPTPAPAKAAPIRAAAHSASPALAVPDVPAEQKAYLLGTELAEAVIPQAPAPKTEEVASAKLKAKSASNASSSKTSSKKGRKAAIKHGSKARKSVKTASRKARASAGKAGHGGQAD